MNTNETPDWLDEYRAQIDETVCWVVSPACICEWTQRTDEIDTHFVLTGRRRHCVLHGEHGVF